VLRGIWRLADPKISLASMSSIFLGACAAASLGPLDWAWLAATAAGIFLIEVGKNASGELFDEETDRAVAPEDRSPFSGGKRVLVDGLLTRAQTGVIAIVGFLGGAGVGLWIAAEREWGVLPLGGIGVFCAYFYNGVPLKLACRGLGEAAVALCYGPLIFAGTVLVQRHEIPPTLLAASFPLGLLIGAFLWTCEFPDYRADLLAGKRNLVVRLGPRRASSLLWAGFAGAAMATALLPAVGASGGAALGLIFLVPAIPAARILARFPETTARIIPAQALALAAFLMYSAGAGLGLLLLD
jgi:1,4-dihydroxy-2-naphthoate octaprenyltransferase